MRTIPRFVTAALLLGSWLAIPARQAMAANLDTTADRVIGQPDFSSNTANNGGVSASSLNNPYGLTMDTQGNLYVADASNNRVLEYDTPMTTDLVADHVFGQPDFTSNTPNNGGVTASSLVQPYGVAVDTRGNLYVDDFGNCRILEYDVPLTTDTIADRVFGQPDFTSQASNTGGLSARSLSYPMGLALDAHGNLYVADSSNHRVLEYNFPLATHAAADLVIGQPDFSTNNPNHGGLNASGLYFPFGVALDAQGNLYVSDTLNNRVLEYDALLTWVYAPLITR